MALGGGGSSATAGGDGFSMGMETGHVKDERQEGSSNNRGRKYEDS